mgnify:CR=1 FL=1
MYVIGQLVESRRFWLAVSAVIFTALGVLFPQISPSLVQSVQGFVLALIVAFTIDDTAVTLALRGKK